MDNNWSVSEIQRNMAARLARDVQMDKTVELLAIIQGMVTDKFGRVSKEAVILEATYAGMSEDEAIRLIDQMVKNRTLKEQDDYLLF